ncbi:DNA polymerase delta subunit 4-like isoform X1 [Carassius carassius]|uniref:DNA polymerase delta subunit 4-like isoform X1 n=2 Tax=Carassius carassius TaxID=217509 RepID=UPI002868EE35|nr:DNA polymerase delta subunit 4-like isoform X1 [Carassius carassius]
MTPSRSVRSPALHIEYMTQKRGLITDTFKVVNKARRGGKRDKCPSPPIAEPEPPQLSEREVDLQELKKFDQEWKFGPCTGISRLQRWERAALHGLNPPQEIKDILLKQSTDQEYTQSLWCDYPL